MATTQPTNTSSSSKGLNLRDLIVTLIIDGAIPYLLYLLLSPRFPNGSIWPLLIASIAPAIGNVMSIIRQRRLDYIGVIVILGLLFTIVASLVTGDQKLLLIRESFFTGGYGVVCLLSLLFPRPLMFVIGRHFVAGNDPVRAAQYNASWQSPDVRASMRLITLVWGIGLLGEFVIRLVLIYTLSTAQVLAYSSIILFIITVLLIAWTVRYGVSRRRQTALQQQQNATSSEAASEA